MTEIAQRHTIPPYAMRRVVVESPFAGDVEANLAYVRACMRDCLMRGEAPVASHALYTQPGILDDTIAEERAHGINAGHAWMRGAHAVVVYTDRGVSKGMWLGIAAAGVAGLPVEYRKLTTAQEAEMSVAGGGGGSWNSEPDAGKSPEALLAEAFKRDLGVVMDPQALRIFIRWRWDRVSALAHKIHDAA